MKNILLAFGFPEKDCIVRPFGSGLINSTWLVDCKDKAYILQKINDHIFKDPGDIAFNIRMIADHLKKYSPEYLFISPLRALDGSDMIKMPDGYYRMFPYVTNSHSINVVEQPGQAYEAARQFARFTKLLSGLDVLQLKITLPDFHNLSLRYNQFERALEKGNKNRIGRSQKMVSYIQEHKHIVEEFEYCKTIFSTRCTHHDTKISNVLFNEKDMGLCVIDLDTVMPGYFISDVGDMMRTYLCPVSEEEKDYSKINIRKDFFDAIVDGYSAEMGTELSAEEKKYFLFAGKFMIYMQAIRFLTDHINDDIYYGATYEGQNFVRAGNQITLLQRLMELP